MNPWHAVGWLLLGMAVMVVLFGFLEPVVLGLALAWWRWWLP